jgi:hypothetical protein
MEYLLRLRDECLLIEQCDSLMTYLQQFTDPVKVARVGLIKLGQPTHTIPECLPGKQVQSNDCSSAVDI